jgi:uncharacterized protein involved in outer membrane biogenesis
LHITRQGDIVRRYSKFLFYLLACLILIFVALSYIGPRVINSASIKEKIVTAASQQLGGDVMFKEIALSLFPRPHADIYEGTVAIPGRASGAIESLTIYPRILPLLKGNFQMIKHQRPLHLQIFRRA